MRQIFRTSIGEQMITVMQGVSGSGKSTLARGMQNTQGVVGKGAGVIVSADAFPGLYTVGKDGESEFHPELLGCAHGGCFRAAINLLELGYSVIVDNTNLTVLEVAPYVALGQAFQVPVRILKVVTDPKVAFKRNLHGVPAHVHKMQVEKLMDFQMPPFWAYVPVTLELYEAPCGL